MGCGGFSWASAKEHTLSTAGKSSAAGRSRKEIIAPLFNPLVPMNALRILPRDTRRIMEMPREDLRIDLREPIGGRRRHGVFRRVHVFCDRALLRLLDPPIPQRRPIDSLKIQITKTVEIFGELGAAGLKLRNSGEAGGAGSMRSIRKHFAQRFDAAAAENHVRRHREIKEIPLRDTGAGLLPPKGDLQESHVAFIAL